MCVMRIKQKQIYKAQFCTPLQKTVAKYFDIKSYSNIYFIFLKSYFTFVETSSLELKL